MPIDKDYSRGDYTTLPADDTNLTTAFSYPEYDKVALQDGICVDLSATAQYSTFQFKKQFEDDTCYPVITCVAKSTLATSLSPVYLQVYNINTPAWVTLDTNNNTAANTNFTLNGQVGAPLSNYQSPGTWYSFRVYQLMQ